MQILITANGSHGDVLPFVGIGRELKRRGHDVTLVASAYFEPLVQRACLHFLPVGTADDYLRIVNHPDVAHPQRGFRVVIGSLLDYLSEAYRKLEEAVVPGSTLLIGSSLAFASRILQESQGIRGVAIHLSPSIFRSSHVPARVSPGMFPAWIPSWAMRGLYRAADRWVVDPIVCPRLNSLRESLNLPPVRRIFHDWIHSPDLTLGLFPDWFAPQQADWPPQTRLTGFPLYDQPEAGLSPEVEAYLAEGPAPVLFTTGTATAANRTFFAESAEACMRSGRRGMLLTRFPDQLPQHLPDGVRHFDHIPFSLLFPRCAAVVHHGGIGTSSQALRAGAPQLVRPMAFDQFDNAHHLVRLGVARELLVKHYKADAVVDALNSLIHNADVADAGARYRQLLEDDDAISRTCDLIEKVQSP